MCVVGHVTNLAEDQVTKIQEVNSSHGSKDDECRDVDDDVDNELFNVMNQLRAGITPSLMKKKRNTKTNVALSSTHKALL